MIVVEWREPYRDEEGHTHYRTIQEEVKRGFYGDLNEEEFAERRAKERQGRWFWMPDQPPTWPTKNGDAA